MRKSLAILGFVAAGALAMPCAPAFAQSSYTPAYQSGSSLPVAKVKPKKQATRKWKGQHSDLKQARKESKWLNHHDQMGYRRP